MNFYEEIKNNLIKSEIYDKVKDYAKARNKVMVYYETGRLLSEAGKQYGKNIIKQYSDKLMLEVGKRYNERNLRYMRKFYEVFNNIKWNPAGSKLTWSHYRELLSLNDKNEILYYIRVCENSNITKKQLQEMIKNNSYGRLSEEAKSKLVDDKKLKMKDLIPNPIIIKGNYDENELKEYTLKQMILNNLDDFLKQLGNCFSYIGNEYKIKFENRYNYIDLLLFNYEYNCFVVIELKATELKKEHIGQIQVYMNYIDKNLRKPFQDKSIGIIICKKNKKFIIEYCSDSRVLSREFTIINNNLQKEEIML